MTRLTYMNVWQQNRVVVSSGSVLWGCLLDGFGPVCRHFSLEDQLSPPSSRTVCFPVRKSSPEAAGSKATAQTMWQNKTWTMQRPRKLSCKSPKTLHSSSQIQKETQRQWKLLNGSPASVCRHTSIHHTPVTRVHITLMFQVSKAVILFYFGSWWNKCSC